MDFRCASLGQYQGKDQTEQGLQDDEFNVLYLVLVAPFAAIVATLADSIVRFLTMAASVLEQGPPTLPRWVAGLPLVGEKPA